MSIQTASKRAYNFSAGPAVLPETVLEQIRDEMMCLPGVGSSVLEISHRSPAFGEILNDARDRFRTVFAVPDTHEILFLQGGSMFAERHDSSQPADRRKPNRRLPGHRSME